MPNWSRRDFLALWGSAGVSAIAARNVVGGPAVRAGMHGWDARSRFVAQAFRDIPELRVAALSGFPPAGQGRILRSAFDGVPPVLYPSALSMHKSRAADFLYASGESSESGDWPGHLLLDGAVDPRKYINPVSGGQCIQILPQYEFAGAGRSTATLARDWTRARIDCRTALPEKPFVKTADLVCWMYREVGDAVDVTCEVMGLSDASRIFTAAAPAATPFEARFGWRLSESRQAEKHIEVSIHATHSGEPSNRTEIRLYGPGQSVVLHAAPRSMELTRLLTANFLDAMTERYPNRLLYSPAILLRAHAIVSRAAAGMSA